jgi:hypothetical protein
VARKSVPLLAAVLPNQSVLLHCLHSKKKLRLDATEVQTSWPQEYEVACL